MKTLLLILAAALLSGCNTTYYATVGAGYKTSETAVYNDYIRVNDPLTARLEVGAELTDSITVGYTHRSQWLSGAPFTRGEYTVDEVFIDYTFRFKL